MTLFNQRSGERPPQPPSAVGVSDNVQQAGREAAARGEGDARQRPLRRRGGDSHPPHWRDGEVDHRGDGRGEDDDRDREDKRESKGEDDKRRRDDKKGERDKEREKFRERVKEAEREAERIKKILKGFDN
jgi:hypothetical protein